MAKRAKKDSSVATDDVVTSVKGFNHDLTCRGYKFEIGKTYSVDGPIKACENGFHACPEHPLDVFEFYPPANSVFHEVTQGGERDDSHRPQKLASATITIGVSLSLSDLAARAVKYVFDRAKPSKGSTCDEENGAASSTGYQGAASSTGEYGAASSTGSRGAASSTGNYGAASSTGYQGAASSTGDYGAASSTGSRGAASSTGDYGAASSTGVRGAASSTGDYGAASSTGYQGAASSTGYQGAASSTGYQGAASSTGSRGAASSTGYQGAASSTGYQGAASSTGKHSVAMASGFEGKAMGAEGCAIALVCRDEITGEILACRMTKVGENGVKPGVYYRLTAAGEFIEAE